jgi:hypothetical protein
MMAFDYLLLLSSGYIIQLHAHGIVVVPKIVTTVVGLTDIVKLTSIVFLNQLNSLTFIIRDNFLGGE